MKAHIYYVYILANKNNSVLYVGVTNDSKESITLQYGSIRPIKVGKIVGRSATLIREKLDNVALICK